MCSLPKNITGKRKAWILEQQILGESEWFRLLLSTWCYLCRPTTNRATATVEQCILFACHCRLDSGKQQPCVTKCMSDKSNGPENVHTVWFKLLTDADGESRFHFEVALMVTASDRYNCNMVRWRSALVLLEPSPETLLGRKQMKHWLLLHPEVRNDLRWTMKRTDLIIIKKYLKHLMKSIEQLWLTGWEEHFHRTIYIATL